MSREKIAQVAQDYEGEHGPVSYNQLKCNQFVLAVLRAAVDKEFPDMLANDFPSSDRFVKTDSPQRGDLIYWNGSPSGHIGIILNPDSKRFIGSQSTPGVNEDSYGSGYWGNTRQPDCYLRYRE